MNKRIFISYSHKDEKWREKLVSHLKSLPKYVGLEPWDDRRIKAGEEWNSEIERAINTTDAAILLISVNFLTSKFITKEEIPRLLRRMGKDKMKIFPLIVGDCLWKEIPWLKQIEVWPKDGKQLASMKDHTVDSILTDFVFEIKNILQPDSEKKISKEGFATHWKSVKISISELPTTGKDLLGREMELKVLDEAWFDEHTHILTVKAWGGVGKTALVNAWLSRMEEENYRGAKRIYGWSFYSQGTREDRQTSAEKFLDDALRWYGDPEPEKGWPWDKGKRLAELIRQHKTLLVLDGMEPLQYPPGGMGGRLKDQALKALLKELCRQMDGLCVITTRINPADMEHAEDKTVRRINLGNLSPGIGAKLLSNLGVKGTSLQLQEAAKEFDCHALALNLLGRYLAVVHDGDVRKKDLIPRLAEEEKEGGHARRVIESYEKFLKGKPELNLLYLLGLFDRPAELAAIEALRENPPIKGLITELRNLSDFKWKYALKHLRDLNLLGKEDKFDADLLDCHPLIREHFAQKLQNKNPTAWKKAHTRLYYYYKDLPEKEFPDTLKEMQPLYTTVTHGCLAGLYQEAFDEVYWPRISREEKYYSTTKLGAYGIDLASLSAFFKTLWSQPFPNLKAEDRSLISNLAGFRLQALGRLREASQPFQSALEGTIKQQDWQNSSRHSSNLSELFLTLGELNHAVDFARQAVLYADKSKVVFEQFVRRTYLAAALHQVGENDKAEKLFLEAEEIQKKDQPKYPFLYAIAGFWFCELLLEQGKYGDVLKRANATIEIAIKNERPLDIGFDNLSLGRVLWLQSFEEKPGDYKKVKDFMDQAISNLREAGTQHHLPRGLLARADLFRTIREFSKAREDLEEVKEVAEQGNMNLHLTDYYLGSARLRHTEGKKEEAREHFEFAKEMVEKMGYHRRDKELEELNERL